jgi:hypothetical protein
MGVQSAPEGAQILAHVLGSLLIWLQYAHDDAKHMKRFILKIHDNY